MHISDAEIQKEQINRAKILYRLSYLINLSKFAQKLRPSFIFRLKNYNSFSKVSTGYPPTRMLALYALFGDTRIKYMNLI